MRKLRGLVLILLVVICPPASAADSGMRVRGAAGIGWPALGDLNDHYLSEYAIPTGIFSERVGSGFAGIIDLSVPLAGGRLRAGVFGMQAGVDQRQKLDIEFVDESPHSYTLTSDLSTHTTGPFLRYEHTLPLQALPVWLGGGVLYGFGSVRLESEWSEVGGFAAPRDELREYHAENLGYMMAAGSGFDLAGSLRLEIEGGYLWLDMGNLRNDNGGFWRFDLTTPNRSLGLDVSGPYVLVGLSVGR